MPVLMLLSGCSQAVGKSHVLPDDQPLSDSAQPPDACMLIPVVDLARLVGVPANLSLGTARLATAKAPPRQCTIPVPHAQLQIVVFTDRAEQAADVIRQKVEGGAVRSGSTTDVFDANRKTSGGQPVSGLGVAAWITPRPATTIMVLLQGAAIELAIGGDLPRPDQTDQLKQLAAIAVAHFPA